MLDGYPLALSIAAAQLPDLGLAPLVDALEHAAVAVRQDPNLTQAEQDKLTSVDVSLELSYGRLLKADAEAARIFSLLALFPAGAEEATLQAVLPAGAPALVHRLVHVSLVERMAGRYYLLAPVRQFALARLPAGAETPAILAAFDYFQNLAEQADALWIASVQGRLGLEIIEADLPNMQFLIDWECAREIPAEAGGTCRSARLVGSLRNFYMQVGLWLSLEEQQRVERVAQAARRLGDTQGEAHVQKLQGDVLAFQDRREEALERYEAALKLYREVGDRLGEANVLQAQGDVLAFQKRNVEALERYEAALKLYREVGDRLGEANVLLELGDIHRREGRYPPAWQAYQDVRQIFSEIGDRYSLARVLYRMGDWQAEQGHSQEAAPLYQEAISLWQAIGLEELVDTVLRPRLQKMGG
ncbi:MAG: tetratricopeptide repeat protein [Chloroflexi bacterium]|nr:tetratricopeptide repeat protein [Chloroflexota bacterium]